jgi:hypothetical protein
MIGYSTFKEDKRETAGFFEQCNQNHGFAHGFWSNRLQQQSSKLVEESKIWMSTYWAYCYRGSQQKTLGRYRVRIFPFRRSTETWICSCCRLSIKGTLTTTFVEKPDSLSHCSSNRGPYSLVIGGSVSCSPSLSQSHQYRQMPDESLAYSKL